MDAEWHVALDLQRLWCIGTELISGYFVDDEVVCGGDACYRVIWELRSAAAATAAAKREEGQIDRIREELHAMCTIFGRIYELRKPYIQSMPC